MLTTREIGGLMKAVGTVVKEHVALAFTGLTERMASLEVKIVGIPAGQDGKSVDPADLIPVIEDEVRKAVAAIPVPADGKDGQDVNPDMVKALVDAAVGDAVAAIPAPRDGKDADVEEVARAASIKVMETLEVEVDPDEIKAAVAAAVAELPEPVAGKDGQNGKDADPDATKAMVDESVAAAVAALPKPKDGENVPLEIVSALVAGEVAKAISALPRAKDGEHGRDAAQMDPLLSIDKARSFPRGTWARHDGGLWMARRATEGMDGWECMSDGLRNLSFEYDGLRTITALVSKSSGETKRTSFEVPMLLDRGTFKDDNTYSIGDVVTSGGSTWVCSGEITGAPGSPGEKGWRMQVRKGRDGKDGLQGKQGETGESGRNGRDLTQMDSEGRKW